MLANAKVWLQTLKDKTGQIASAGYTALWLPPPSDSVSQQGYLPRDLYNLKSCYGDEGALRECIQVLHEANLKAIADIVINHRCAHAQVLPSAAIILQLERRHPSVYSYAVLLCSQASCTLVHHMQGVLQELAGLGTLPCC